MRDSETKPRIDNCRHMLVGKVPDPKSQVEQITIAPIYPYLEHLGLNPLDMGAPVQWAEQWP